MTGGSAGCPPSDGNWKNAYIRLEQLEKSLQLHGPALWCTRVGEQGEVSYLVLLSAILNAADAWFACCDAIF